MTIQRILPSARLSEVSIHNNLAYFAGQVPELTIEQNSYEQTKEVLGLIDKLLAEIGSNKSNILTAQIFLADMQDYAQLNQAWDEWVDHVSPPSRATVEAKLADPRWKVEIVIKSNKQENIMENWTNEIWLAIGIAFIVGLFIGYIIVRLTKGSVKHQAKTEAELKTVKNQLDTQKAQIEKHFAESAELFKILINDYQKLYRHYATSSNNLLGEKDHKGLFTQQLITAIDKSQNEQPRDYSEGASGLFKENKEEN